MEIKINSKSLRTALIFGIFYILIELNRAYELLCCQLVLAMERQGLRKQVKPT